MVLPIIIGVGITIAAITAKSGLIAFSKYSKLSSVTIAHLNGIRISRLDQNRMNVSHDMRKKFLRYPGGFSSFMSESEALEILDIRGDEIMKLDETMLKKKHRRCMLANHPDKGGSPYLAMKVNEAKEVLEKSYMFKH